MNGILQPLVLLDFETAEFKPFWREIYCRLTGNRNQLLTFDQVRNGLPITGQRDRGLQAVPNVTEIDVSLPNESLKSS